MRQFGGLVVKNEVAHSLFLFRGMESDSVEKLLRCLESIDGAFREIEFSSGDVISDGGEICCIISGSADIKAAPNSDAILRRVTAGDTFGAGMLYTDDSFSPTVAVARTKCLVLFVPKKTVDILIGESPEVAKNYIAFLSDKIAFLNRRILAFSAGDTESKLAVYLYQISGEGRNCEDIPVGDSFTTVAKKLNMGRASLYRTLDSFERDGLIQRDGTKISILKLDELLKIIKK